MKKETESNGSFGQLALPNIHYNALSVIIGQNYILFLFLN